MLLYFFQTNEAFKYLVDGVKDITNMYSQFEFTVTASVLLVMGWILTSDKARAFIKDKTGIKVGFTIVAAIAFIVEVYLSIEFHKDSRNLCTKAGEFMGNIPAAAYDYKCIDTATVVLFLIGHLLMYILLLYLVWRIAPDSDGAAAEAQK